MSGTPEVSRVTFVAPAWPTTTAAHGRSRNSSPPPSSPDWPTTISITWIIKSTSKCVSTGQEIQPTLGHQMALNNSRLSKPARTKRRYGSLIIFICRAGLCKHSSEASQWEAVQEGRLFEGFRGNHHLPTTGHPLSHILEFDEVMTLPFIRHHMRVISTDSSQQDNTIDNYHSVGTVVKSVSVFNTKTPKTDEYHLESFSVSVIFIVVYQSRRPGLGRLHFARKYFAQTRISAACVFRTMFATPPNAAAATTTPPPMPQILILWLFSLAISGSILCLCPRAGFICPFHVVSPTRSRTKGSCRRQIMTHLRRCIEDFLPEQQQQ